MFRIFFYILVIAGISYGLSLIEGDLTIQWAGGQIEPLSQVCHIGLVCSVSFVNGDLVCISDDYEFSGSFLSLPFGKKEEKRH